MMLNRDVLSPSKQSRSAQPACTCFRPPAHLTLGSGQEPQETGALALPSAMDTAHSAHIFWASLVLSWPLPTQCSQRPP